MTASVNYNYIILLGTPSQHVTTTCLHSIQDAQKKYFFSFLNNFFKPEQDTTTGLTRTKTRFPQQLYSWTCTFVSWFHFIFVLFNLIWLQVCPFFAAPHHCPSLSLALFTLLTLFLLCTCALSGGTWTKAQRLILVAGVNVGGIPN